MVPAGAGERSGTQVGHPASINSFTVMRPRAAIRETKLSQESMGLGDKSSINYTHKAISLRVSGMRQKETIEKSKLGTRQGIPKRAS